MKVLNVIALAALAMVGVVSAGCDMQPRDRENRRNANPAAPGEMPNPNQGVPRGPDSGPNAPR